MKITVYSFIVSCYLTVAATLSANAQPGSLDPTFGTGGKVTTAIEIYSDYGWSAAIQSDDKIVVAGWSENGANNDFAIVRYNSDGSLDNTFGSGGKVITAIGPYHDQGQSVAIQTDGKIVVAGYSFFFTGTGYDFALVRYNSDGSLDNTFGTGGIVTTDFANGNDYARSVAIQTDGKILVAGDGFVVTTCFVVARYNTNGSLDNTFGSGGKVTTAIGSSGDYGKSVVIQTDHKIVVAGPSYTGTNEDFALVRYNDDGTLDNTFNSNGKVTTPIGSSNDQCASAAIQIDGKIVVAGWSVSTNGDEDFALVRYNSNGSLDNTFGSGGKVTTAIGTGDDVGESVAIQSDGKIVLAGSRVSTDNDFALVCYNSNGSLDNTFGTGGKVTTDFGSLYDFGNSVIIQANGKIIVAGRSGTLSNYDFAVARYNGSTAVGIAENNAEANTINISPNPFINELSIKGTKERGEIIIFDMRGKEYMRQKTFGAETKIKTESLLPGFYLLNYNDGNKTMIFKLIKF